MRNTDFSHQSLALLLGHATRFGLQLDSVNLPWNFDLSGHKGTCNWFNLACLTFTTVRRDGKALRRCIAWGGGAPCGGKVGKTVQPCVLGGVVGCS